MNYCTYFDKNYLSRGLALYHSLLKNCDSFHLYIVAFDDFTYNFFQAKKLKYITCISLNDFEDEKLKKVKNKRSKVEYLWTCTPSIILFFIKKFNLKLCIYIDADIYFFSNPKNIIKNNNFSTIITSHNYHPQYDQTKTSGKFCVQYVAFKNTSNSLKILDWWRKKCLKWCFNRVEDNKFGDQKYLDSWEKKFRNVVVVDDLGVGVAPWNAKRFEFSNGFIKYKKKKIRLVFYHFHDLKFFFNNRIAFLSSYYLDKRVKNLIYNPYIKKILFIEKKYDIIFDANSAKANLNLFTKILFYSKLLIKFMIYFRNFKKIS